MSVRFIRGPMVVALVASVCLVGLPACKKKKDAEPNDNPYPAPPAGPVPEPGMNPGSGLPPPPRGPFFSSTTEAPMRQSALNDMKEIILGLHNFHDAHGALPAGYADKTGKPGLSWRVAILPYIEQGALFKQFKLDEPWDSDHNKKLISQMPKIFAPPRTETNGYTFYRGFTGQGTWLPPQKQSARPGQPLLGVKFSQVTDGLSNTILVAEADPVIWTKPDEVPFTPGTAPKLGGVFNSGFVVGMGDGSVRFIRNTIDKTTLANAIQINDGNILNLDQ